jgi:transketolase
MINFNILKKTSNSIRGLSIDAINKANSGHPGLPLGCADLISVLFGYHLNYFSKKPNWLNRDKFILSAGHGSMLQYSILHLAQYDISLDDIKNFRQLNYFTAGHPEKEIKKGVETTTGPLGQGLAQAVGLAIAEKKSKSDLNTKEHTLIDHSIYCLVGDGCLMEGISSEACSLAGHLNCDNLIVIYDKNNICLDGPTDECFTEDVELRFKSYNWEVISINGHDYNEINNALIKAKQATKPVLIIAKTTIGYGSPNRSGSSEAHGKALGEEEGNLTKEKLGIPLSPKFFVDPEVTTFFSNKTKESETNYSQWTTTLKNWSTSYPEKAQLLNELQTSHLSKPNKTAIKTLTIKPNLATRASSSAVIQELASLSARIIGGSADLSCSDSTFIKSSGIITKDDFTQNNIKYGVREFAMASIATGLSLSTLYQPFIGTFLTFSDYMKNAIRLSALMSLPVIYQFTHDSILLGEDGPTHQPVEHLASLRSIPNLNVYRPADTNEVKGAWIDALSSKSPSALILSRQSCKDLDETNIDNVSRGAYIVKNASNENSIDIAILSTGSELNLGLDVAKKLEKENISTQVVSFPSWEKFDTQEDNYKNTILSKNIKHFVVIEAQSSFGWHKYAGNEATFVTVESFGLSAPGNVIAEEFGFSPEAIIKKIKSNLVLIS